MWFMSDESGSWVTRTYEHKALIVDALTRCSKTSRGLTQSQTCSITREPTNNIPTERDPGPVLPKSAFGSIDLRLCKYGSSAPFTPLFTFLLTFWKTSSSPTSTKNDSSFNFSPFSLLFVTHLIPTTCGRDSSSCRLHQVNVAGLPDL